MQTLMNGKTPPKTQLVDKRNFHLLKDRIIAEMVGVPLVGFDLETQDENRHEGLNLAMGVGEDGHKGANKKLLFDTQRTIITGFSLYTRDNQMAYYFNIAHADVENRLHFWEDGVHEVLSAKEKDAYWVAHNAPFELTFMETGWGADMAYKINFPLGEKVICTLQLAVTAFNEDSYSMEDFANPGLGGIENLFGAVRREFASYTPGQELTKEQDELVYKVIAKESDAEHSYNGYVKSIRYGFGLKQLALKFLGYQQVTFEQVMAGAAHMGLKTGEEIAAYGADDAWVCLFLYEELLQFLMRENPAGIATFFSQENPMIHVYSEVWREGVKINLKKVRERKEEERIKVRSTLVKMKAAIKALLPFPAEVHEKLVKYDPKAYGKTDSAGNLVTAEKYRKLVTAWANSPNSDDAFTEVYKVKTSLSKQWATDKGLPESKGLSLTYYQLVRCIVLDLCELSFQLSDGKIQSDADALTVMKERHIKKNTVTNSVAVWNLEKKEYEPGSLGRDSIGNANMDFLAFMAKLEVLNQYEALKATDQSIKLYLSPYENLTDPDTSKVHPILNSQLNSRRMALASPNLSQLAKFSAMGYVRSFFESDSEDYVIVSADWSAVELVLIGDASGDKRFAWAYGQVPHQDIHSLTASGLLDMDLEEFGALPDKKQKRTELGKPANFGYWYSGALGTVAKELGWTSEKMWEFVDKYRQTYPEAEQWRLEAISTAQEHGKVQLPDKLMRYRLESTAYWGNLMRQKFYRHGDVIGRFGDLCIKKIQRRSGNQAVNSLIQGTGGTLAKRSILAMRPVIKDKGYRARLMFPVHDELVYCVHRDDAVAFQKDLGEKMCHHPEIVKTLKLDVAVAVGLNYWAWDKDKNPKGQIELDEASKVPCLPEDRWGQKLTDAERQKVVDWLFEKA